MLVKFFFLLRKTGVPVSITELLTLLEALKAGPGNLLQEFRSQFSRYEQVRRE